MGQKINPTISYLLNKQPDYVATVPPPVGVPDNRVPMPFFSTVTPPPIETTYEDVANSIEASALENTVFIFDTCFIGAEDVPDKFWDVVLSKKVVFFPEILSELMLWLNTPKHNLYFHRKFKDAYTSKSLGIDFVEPTKLLGLPESPYHIAASYYHRLLSFRKTAYRDFTAFYKRCNQVDPPPEELEQAVQHFVQGRGMMLAKKGVKDANNPNLLNDEWLVVLAFFYAVLTGKEVCIVTRDKDVIEQFYKLQYLVDTHYLCCCMAKMISEYPSRYKAEYIKNIFSDDEKLLKQFNGHVDLSDAKAVDIPNRWFNDDGSATEVVPPTITGIPIHAMLWTRYDQTSTLKVSTITTMTAKEVSTLFWTKGKTLGRNTDLFGDYNLHMNLAPNLERCFYGRVLAKDRFYPALDGFPFDIAIIDWLYAIMGQREGVGHIKYQSPE